MKKFPLICVDNFYKNPEEIRQFALKQNFFVSGNYPGKRTENIDLLNKDIFQQFCEKFFSICYDRTISNFEIDTRFWLTTSLSENPKSPKNNGWIHTDNYHLGGVIYLSPGLDLNLGTTFYEQIKKIDKESQFNYNKAVSNFYCNGKDYEFDKMILEHNSHYTETAKIGNVFNRLVSFDASTPHSPSHYYMGKDIRLAQVFFVKQIDTDSNFPLYRVN